VPRRCDGFTLIELMASLAILAMISLLITSGVVTGRRVWSGLEASASAGESVDGAQVALRQTLERVFPATRYDSDEPYVDFAGAADSIEFLAPPPLATGPSALRRYRLSLNSGDLVLASHSDVAADPRAPFGDDQVLLRGVQALDIAYYGAGPADAVKAWRYLWKTRPEPPELVRIRVDFAQGDRRQWPDLIVRPLADVDSQCVFDHAGEGCRGRM
jgi:general secretion pathway protein J